MALRVRHLRRQMTVFGIWFGILFSIWLMLQGRTIEDRFRRENIPYEWPNYESKYYPNYDSKLQPNYKSKLQTNYASKLQPNYESKLQPNYKSKLQTNYESKLQPNHESKLQPNYKSKLQPNYKSKLQPNYKSKLQPNYESTLQPNYESTLQPNHESKLQPNHEPKLQPNHEWNPDIDVPLIYFVTPSKVRSEQKADLTRLSHTLRLVPRLHWILIEDRTDKSDMVRDLLANSKVAHTHLAVKTTDRNDKAVKSKRAPPRGVDQRNAGLDWIAEHGEYPSVFYPGDDDNTYDLRLFEEMRYIKKVGVWPVGLVGKASYESPIVVNGKVVGWATIFGKSRKFRTDMAGFAVNTELLKRPNPPRFRSDVTAGFMETNFLEQLNITIGDLEPKADNCTKVLVWHTQTMVTEIQSSIFVRSLRDKYRLPDLEV